MVKSDWFSGETVMILKFFILGGHRKIGRLFYTRRQHCFVNMSLFEAKIFAICWPTISHVKIVLFCFLSFVIIFTFKLSSRKKSNFQFSCTTLGYHGCHGNYKDTLYILVAMVSTEIPQMLYGNCGYTIFPNDDRWFQFLHLLIRAQTKDKKKKGKIMSKYQEKIRQ